MRRKHARNLHIDGVLRRPIHLLRELDAHDILADETELIRFLQFVFGYFRCFAWYFRKSGDLAIRKTPAGFFVNDDVRPSGKLGDRRIPVLGGVRLQDLADLRAETPEITLKYAVTALLPAVYMKTNDGFLQSSSFGGATTTRTFDQSASSSSPRMSGRDVSDPCPISAAGDMIATVSSVEMVIHGLSAIMAPIVVLLALLCASYWQTIRAYPSNGGAYVVSKENLGTNASLLAAAALMIDYVLNVAVGISAGVGALVSAVPILHPYVLPLCLGTLVICYCRKLARDTGCGPDFCAPDLSLYWKFSVHSGLRHFQGDPVRRPSSARCASITPAGSRGGY